MEMQITLTLPELTEFNPVELRTFTAAKLYESQKLSLGQAAKAAGLSKWDFAEQLGNYGVSLFQQTVEDLEADIKNAQALLR